MQKFEITDAEGGAALPVELTLEAPSNRVAGKSQDVVFIDLAVKPDKAAVEETLSAFLAETLQIGLGKIAIASGRSLTHKVVIVMGITPEAIEQRLFT